MIARALLPRIENGFQWPVDTVILLPTANHGKREIGASLSQIESGIHKTYKGRRIKVTGSWDTGPLPHSSL